MGVKINAYAYCTRAVQYDMPFEASIRSWAALCSSGRVVVTTDPRFDDGTLEALRELESRMANLLVIESPWQLDEPGCDGLAKATAREEALVGSPDVLVPFDVDEVLHEGDVRRLQSAAEEQVARNWPIVSTGCFDWYNGEHIRLSAPLHKPRLTLASAPLTHGIPAGFRQERPDGKIWCDKGLSDGAGLIHSETLAPVADSVCLSEPLRVRVGAEHMPDETSEDCELLVASMCNREHVWIRHYSWYDIPRKWAMEQTWEFLWGHLDGDIPSVEKYDTFKDGQSVDFWDMNDSRASLQSYIPPLLDQMSKPDVVRLAWMGHPAVVKPWLNGRERRIWRGKSGLGKEEALQKPSRIRAVRDRVRQRLRPEYDY
jgi:hypothetical protein